MKYWLPALALLSSLALAGGGDTLGSLPNSAPGGGFGDKGVADGSCWKDKDGNHIAVDVRGTTHGDQKVKMTHGDESGEGVGTPASDDGCRESEPIKVGTETYDVKGGKVRHKQEDGTFKPMSETKDEACADEQALPS